MALTQTREGLEATRFPITALTLDACTASENKELYLFQASEGQAQAQAQAQAAQSIHRRG
ncbi:hypothetical protein IFM47457_03486 [Aspergillus lentulus]|nr:hypothetical protein IFM47457_03486 [Aspergillus lentulus]